MNQEIQNLETFISTKRRVHDYDAEYTAASRRLTHLKNPAGNYAVERYTAVSGYLSARRIVGNTPYKQWSRQNSLSMLADAKAYYLPLLGKAGAA